MIISASRRTDIPAFYARWFINRLRAGYCSVPNPFNWKQVFRVSLVPQDVDVIVFWTRNPRPLFPFLDEMDELGYRYYFQYTLLGYPRQIDPYSPTVEPALRTFRELAERVGSEHMVWRYDPIIFTQLTDPDYHLAAYERIAHTLRGYTPRSVISFLTPYHKIQARLDEMAQRGVEMLPFQGAEEPWFGDFMRRMVAIAEDNGMVIQSCASELDLANYGVLPGKCIDDDLIQEVFGIDVTHEKDPGQRKLCGCVRSRDIGAYDTCLFGCPYCYATTSFERARRQYQEHNPDSPSLVGWYEPDETLQMKLMN